MKINFKKIATVLGSAVMIGSTLGMAAAASFPAPFVQGGAANVAVVVGANAALSDAVAATNIGSSLATQLAAQTATGNTGSGATTSGGDSYQLQKTSTKFHLGNGITDVVSATVTSDNLPTLLKDGVYVDKNNDEFDYTQKIVLANSTLSMFDDNDYKADTPTVGIRIPSGSNVLNYTVTFTDQPNWGNLATTNVNLLDKTYYVLSTSSNTTMTLLDSAATTILNEGDSKTLTVNGVTYNVSIGFIGSTQVKLIVNGVTTNALAEAQTQKLSDGAFVGVKSILTQDYAGGVKQVEFSIGSGKLKLTNGNDVEMNDNTVSGLKAVFTNSSEKLASITLAWTADNDLFAAPDTIAEMPGFKAVELAFGGMTFPTEETIAVEAGSDSYVTLKQFPLKDSTEDINLLYTSSSAPGNITGSGKDANNILRTVNSGNLTFNAKNSDAYFIASWSDTSNSESYLMRATNFNTADAGLTNKTTIEYKKGGSWTELKKDAQTGTPVSIGSLGFTVRTIDYNAKTVIIEPDSSVKFNVLYSKTGLKVQLPWVNTTTITRAGAATAVNCTPITFAAGQIGPVLVANATDATINVSCYATSFPLIFVERDKSGNVAQGATFNATIGFNSATTPQLSVTDVVGESVTFAQQQSTKIWESYMYSALATKFLWDKSGDQQNLDVVYHGSEAFGNVFLTAPGVTITAGSSGNGGSATALGQVTVFDNEVSAVQGKNLIVVGGSCINTVAAKLLGSDTPICGAAFTTATGVSDGQYLLQAFNSPYTTGKVAMLVAGYNAADTTKAVTYLTTNAVNTTVGSKQVLSSTTVAGTA